MGERTDLGRAAVAVVRTPRLWPTALREARRMAPTSWWRRPPFLPVPDRDYLRFRLETQYGASGRVEAEDLVTFLRWCRDSDR